MIKKKKKNQKPIEIDAHFKYRCPKSNCGFDHWLSLKECQTKDFKIVCDCGFVFKPKKISKIKIVYSDIKLVDNKEQPAKIIEKPKIPVDFKNDCGKLLISYGFTKEEAISLCEKAFEKNPVNSSGLLIKYILQNLEQLNVNN
jgi:uncharacterized protein YbcC (UPF0753/DUF2309 family)